MRILFYQVSSRKKLIKFNQDIKLHKVTFTAFNQKWQKICSRLILNRKFKFMGNLWYEWGKMREKSAKPCFYIPLILCIYLFISLLTLKIALNKTVTIIIKKQAIKSKYFCIGLIFNCIFTLILAQIHHFKFEPSKN